MIEKMQYINLTGPVGKIDDVIEKYISNYDIQLEHAHLALAGAEGVEAFSEPNPYAALYAKAQSVRNTVRSVSGRERVSKDEAEDVIAKVAVFLDREQAEKAKLTRKRQEISEIVANVSHFSKMDFKVEDLSLFTEIVYRFGRLPKSGFLQFQAYLYEDSHVLFEMTDSDNENIWCVYFAPRASIEEEDVKFSSFHFHHIDFPTEFDGEPLTGSVNDIIALLNGKTDEINRQITVWENETLEEIGVTPKRLAAALEFVTDIYYKFECRRYAAKTMHDYFVFVGWMSEAQARKLAREIESDTELGLLSIAATESTFNAPPTKFKNFALFRPFEQLILMYGAPCYNELDPTPFVALSYSLLFGMMYGDVGHGFTLSLVGLFLYKVKKVALGSILAIVGLFSALFGFMYGSVFGFEDVLPAVWLRPSKDIMTLVYITVAIGACTVFLCMCFNILNAVKKRDFVKLIFDANGFSGLLFYASIIFFSVSVFILGRDFPGWVIAVCLVVPLILIAFREPLGAVLCGKKDKAESKQGFGMFLFISLMELIDVVLSFFTNTLSFVRVAGYAISHAGLMSVVMILSGAESGRANIAVVVLGNAFVMGLEGLIVFIQVMRLEYYEMFSRYYAGGGKEFLPYKSLISQDSLAASQKSA